MVGFPDIMGNPGLAFKTRQYKCGLSQVIQISRSIGSKTRFFDLLQITVRDIHISRVLQTIQMKPILLCVCAEPAILGSTKTALKFKYEI